MKKKEIILIAATVVAVSAITMILFKKKKVNDRLNEVADEGYELAHDVLYPLKNQRKRHDGYSPVV
jgi:hypothetical protein